MKRFMAIVVTALVLAGCTPLERTAYNTVVAAKAFLDKEKSQHPECASGGGVTAAAAPMVSPICQDLNKATGAKDSLINAIEVYCSGPDFNNGGKCNQPDLHSASGVQAEAKLRAAITQYNQIAADLKTATGNK